MLVVCINTFSPGDDLVIVFRCVYFSGCSSFSLGFPYAALRMESPCPEKLKTKLKDLAFEQSESLSQQL